jgi:hypothetical protein
LNQLGKEHDDLEASAAARHLHLFKISDPPDSHRHGIA